MAGHNNTPYYLQGNVRLSLSAYLTERREANARPCCAAYVAGGGHDLTCSRSGHAAYIDYSQSAVPTPRTSRSVPQAQSAPDSDDESAVSSLRNSTSALYTASSSDEERSSLDPNDQLFLSLPEVVASVVETPRSVSNAALLLPPPAYSAIPRASEHSPFREYPPSYDEIIRADRFQCVRWVPVLGRLARPETRALNEAELAQVGIFIGTPLARPSFIRRLARALASLSAGDRTWILVVIIAAAFILGLVLAKTT